MTDAPGLDSLAERFHAPRLVDRPLQIVHGFDLLGARHGRDGDDGIERALDALVAQGVGGIVTNVGFGGYLRSAPQWETLRRGMAAARERGLSLWIYDEEGYPSGAAGGLVLEGHPELEAMGLACRVLAAHGPADLVLEQPDCPSTLVAVLAWNETGEVRLDPAPGADGRLIVRVPAGTWTVAHLFEKPAYEGTHAEGNVHASRRYINVLDPRAVDRFIRVTHEAYERELGADLGGARAFFTDEPSLMSAYIWPLPASVRGKTRVQDPLRSTDRTPMVAWSPGFPGEFRQRAGYDIMERLPDLFVDRGPGSRRVREDYRRVAAEVFADAYCGRIGAWCEARGLASTGHFLVEENVLWHVALLGDLFTLVRRMTWPGIDLLDSNPRSIVATEAFMVARQVSSAARLAGRTEVICEASDWSTRIEGRPATPDEMRGTASLLYLLGVTTIAAYYDPLLPSYPAYTLHAARLRVMLGPARHDPGVAVLYPVRAVQGLYRPQADPPLPETQAPAIRAVTAGWTTTCRTLLEHQVDFDCIDEQALQDGEIVDGALCAAGARCRVIVVPPTDRLGDSAHEALARFAGAGGRVVTVGDPRVPPLEGPWPREQLPDAAAFEEAVGSVVDPTVRLTPRSRTVLCARFALPSGVLYFVVNCAPGPSEIEASFGESGAIRMWDPVSGDVTAPVPYGAGAPVRLLLEGYGSLFVTLTR